MRVSLFSRLNYLPLAGKGALLIALPFFVQICIIVIYGALAERGDALNIQQHHHKEIIGRVNWLSATVLCSSLSAMTASLTGDEKYSQIASEAQESADRELEALSSASLLDQKQTQSLSEFKQSWSQLKTVLSDVKNYPIKVKETAGSDQVKVIFSNLFSARRGILQAEARNTPVDKMDLKSSRQLLRMSLNDLVILDTLAAIGLYGIFHLQIVSRVAQVADNSLRLASGRDLHAQLEGTDEIQKLDLNFHSMADQLLATRKSLEASERRIRDIVNNVPHGLLVLSTDMTIEFANKTVQPMFKHPPEELIGQNVESLFDTNGKFLVLIEDSLENSQEVDAKRCDGSIFRAEVSSNKIDFVDGERILLAVEDINERYELSRLKKEFVAMVCHDLRNPLSAIQLFQEMLAQKAFGELTEPGPKLLNNARSSAAHLMTLTNDILESEKLEGGTSNLLLSKVDLNALIEQAIASASAATTLKEITVNCETFALELDCDESKILRVLSNLIGNAAKFSPQKSEITITVEVDATTVRVSVCDEGPGVPENMHQSIFEKFFQVQRKHAISGFGLGLSICKQFVGQHGGSIGVSNNQKRGSTFWFVLPLHSALQPIAHD